MNNPEPYKNPECPHCGEVFKRMRFGNIPTHDFPKPCRQVCPGSGQSPRRRPDIPLWKDDMFQRGKDFLDQRRSELLVYGFAVVKQVAQLTVGSSGSGVMKCPLCLGNVRYSIAELNWHCAARCETENCINMRE